MARSSRFALRTRRRLRSSSVDLTMAERLHARKLAFHDLSPSRTAAQLRREARLIAASDDEAGALALIASAYDWDALATYRDETDQRQAG